MFKDYKCIHKLSKNTKHGMKTITVPHSKLQPRPDYLLLVRVG